MMGYLDQCRACDERRHDSCDGTVTVMDQDGASRYVCKCAHRRPVLDAQRRAHNEARVRRLMRDLGMDGTHRLDTR